MSLFEEYLTLGPWLAEEERRDLYKYLLLTRQEIYQLYSDELLVNGFLETTFANGKIYFLVNDSLISYKTKKIDEPDYGYEIRKLPIKRLNIISRSRLKKFFAQAELDVLRNYPNPGKSIEESRGYGINVYPYYDLNYYSKGRGKILGIFNKMLTKDGELLNKLLAS